jgi:hypothetical protein
MTDEKKELLKSIFWEMNEISSRTETKTETVIDESDDGHGNIVEEEVTVTQLYLYIMVSHKTADEMANAYGFNADQREQLAELLADENNSLWTAVLYGITGTDEQIVAVALSQIGNVAVSRIGAGMALVPAWSGAPALFHGVRTNVGISTPALFRNTRAACGVSSGSRSVGNGRTTAQSHRPA